MSSLGFCIVALALALCMWGHAPTCPCSVCKSLPRVFSLVSLGGVHPSFIPWAGDRFRLLEGEFRDELQRLGPPPAVPVVQRPPEATVPPAPGAPEGPGKGAEEAREDTGQAAAHPPKPGAGEAEGLLQLTPKVRPALAAQAASATPPGRADPGKRRAIEKPRRKSQRSCGRGFESRVIISPKPKVPKQTP